LDDRHHRIAFAAVGQIAQSGDHAASLRIDGVLAMDKVRALAGVSAGTPGRPRGNVDRRAERAAEGGTGECRADALGHRGLAPGWNRRRSLAGRCARSGAVGTNGFVITRPSASERAACGGPVELAEQHGPIRERLCESIAAIRRSTAS
jgi:hypothetical protein